MLKPDTIAQIQRMFRDGVPQREIARNLGVHRESVHNHTRNLPATVTAPVSVSVPSLIPASSLHFRRIMPTSGRRTYLLTAAQNNTDLHEGFWTNLQAYASHLDAEIMVGSFVYNKNAMGQRNQEVHGAEENEEGGSEISWDDRLAPYRFDRRGNLAPGLDWMGHMNALPTNVDPLAGLTGYSRGASAVYPHVKVALRSMATAPGEAAKFLYTTGAVTLPNYIQRKAGQIAEFHHVIGALIVEVDEAGVWWARQINADDNGNFQDLDTQANNGRITTGHHILAVNWGDIHERKMEPDMLDAAWGSPRTRDIGASIMDEMRPQYQFFHDLIDAEGFNPHDADDSFRRYELSRLGRDDVSAEMDAVADFLHITYRPWSTSVVVASNHDDMFKRWLARVDHKKDPRNVKLYHLASLAKLDAIDAGDKEFDLVKWYLEPKSPPTVFLSEAKPSLRIAGIEFGLHGHRGPNGTKGTPKGFTTLATRINTGHTHTASIYDGVYTAGVQARLFHGYNTGYSSWSNSMIFTYPNGKRAIVTMRDLLYRRPRS